MKIVQRLSLPQFQKSNGSVLAVFGYTTYLNMVYTGRKIILDLGRYDFDMFSKVQELDYPLPDVEYIICEPDHLKQVLKKWPPSLVYVKTIHWYGFPKYLKGYNIAVIKHVSRQSKLMSAVDCGRLDGSRDYMLYGLSNILELSEYYTLSDSVLSRLKFVVTGIAFEYALYNIRFSRAVGIWRKISGFEDDVEYTASYRDEDLGYEREETFILNQSILENVAKGVVHVREVL